MALDISWHSERGCLALGTAFPTGGASLPLVSPSQPLRSLHLRALRLCTWLVAVAAMQLAFCARAQAVAPTATTNPPVATLTIRTAAGKIVAFTPAGPPSLEIVNDQLHLALSSREGMIFELTGIPAKPDVATRRYRGAEFRALLLHSGFQEEAASHEPFTTSARLVVQKHGGKSDSPQRDFRYNGKLKAGAETLEVRFRWSGPLPEQRRFLSPDTTTPSAQPK